MASASVLAPDPTPKRRQRRAPALLSRFGLTRRELLIFTLATGVILLLRLPSFFEPPWHTDEGIFAAVAERVLHGGTLYADAWESKPPLFLYLYVGVFKLLGAGVLQLRVAATLSAIGTQWALYATGLRLMSRRRAMVGSLLAGVLLGVPFWEGTLALTETFTVLPSAAAVACCLTWDARRSQHDDVRWVVAAGVLFGVAVLLRQTAGVVAVACCLWLLLSGRPWLRPTLVMAIASFAVVLPATALFVATSSFHWFWDANAGFFLQYVPSGREIPFHYRFVILLPVVTAVVVLAWLRQRGESPAWGLPALWLVLTLAAAMLTGRPYSHYFLQTFLPLALLLALLRKPRLTLLPLDLASVAPRLALAGSLVVLWVLVVMPEFGGNPFAMRYTKAGGYYPNFAEYALGVRDRAAYNDYFDRRVNLTEDVDAALHSLHADGASAYIWGEYPWVYALADLDPSYRYMTSFYVLLIPTLDGELGPSLTSSDPRYIIVAADARTYLSDSSPVVGQRYAIATLALDDLLARRYERVAVVGKAEVYERTTERVALPPSALHLDNGYDYPEP